MKEEFGQLRMLWLSLDLLLQARYVVCWSLAKKATQVVIQTAFSQVHLPTGPSSCDIFMLKGQKDCIRSFACPSWSP